LGWTHGAGSGRAMAELISGLRPQLDFAFYGFALASRQLKLTPASEAGP